MSLKRYKLLGLKDNTLWLKMPAAITQPDGIKIREPGISVTVKNELFETENKEIQKLIEKKYPKAEIDEGEAKKLETSKDKKKKPEIQTGPTRVIK